MKSEQLKELLNEMGSYEDRRKEMILSFFKMVYSEKICEEVEETLKKRIPTGIIVSDKMNKDLVGCFEKLGLKVEINSDIKNEYFFFLITPFNPFDPATRIPIKDLKADYQDGIKFNFEPFKFPLKNTIINN